MVESTANELPFIILYWLIADTALAVAQRDIASPLGWTGLSIALLTVIGVAIVVARAIGARATLAGALAAGLGANWEAALDEPLVRQLRPHLSLGRALLAPLRFPSRVVQRTRDIPYGPAGKHNLLDVYRHKAQTAKGPTLVYFHPGGFFSGGKSREARPLFDQLVRHGWVCVSANYRLGRAGTFPNCVVDAKRVISRLRRNSDEYGIDPDRLVVAGGSAGAYLAAMCALSANDAAFQPGFEQADTSVTAAVALYGYYGAAPAYDGRRPSAPADYVRAEIPPFLVIHGTHDPMVSVQGARLFVEELRTMSTSPTVYAELYGAQHNFDRFSSIRYAAVIDGIEAFTAWVLSARCSASDFGSSLGSAVKVWKGARFAGTPTI